MTHPLRLACFSLLISALMACSQEAPVAPDPEPHSLIELSFSPPPIDLKGVQAQFAENIPYDQYEDTRFDILLPNSSSPTGLVVFIHGGGFTGGNKAFAYSTDYQDQVLELLSKQVAVASINYRLIQPGDEEGVLKSLHDSRRALQYLRYVSEDLNVDPERITLFGSSAGASTALWLATHDDFKDEDHADPVLRESTRVKGIALRATQSSLDIEGRWLNDVFGEFGATFEELLDEFGEASLLNFYGVKSLEAYHSPETEAYRKQVDMLSLLSADDPEIWVTNTGGHNNQPQTTGSFNHHPFHAREIKEFAEAAGVPTVATYGKPILYRDPSQEEFVDFLLRKLDE